MAIDWNLILTFFIPIISIVISVFAFFISFGVNWKRIKLAQQSISLPIVKGMFDEFRNSTFKSRREDIFTSLNPEVNIPYEWGYDLASRLGDDLYYVSFFLDHLGLLVYCKMVNEDYVIGFMGGSISKLWDVIEPYLIQERKRRNYPQYQVYFQYLVSRIRKRPPEKVRKKLEKMRKKFNYQDLEQPDQKESKN